MPFDRTMPAALGSSELKRATATLQKPRAFRSQLRRTLRWLVPAILAVAALIGYRMTAERRPVDLHLRTTAIDRGPISAKFSATGALSALVTVSVGSQVSGRIESLAADFGSHVRQGDVIARIEPSFFKAAVAQATANHAAARAALARAQVQRDNSQRQFVRLRELWSNHLVARADFDAAESAWLAARADVTAAAAGVAQSAAALEQAQLNLRYTTIVSPIDGVVISRNVDVGQTVAATLQAPTLFTIAQDLAHMQVHANVAEADIGKLHGDVQVTFSVDAYPQHVFPGVVRQLRDNAQTLQNVVTYDAVIDVDNTQGLLKPGMTANVSVVYARRGDVLRVSNAALRYKPSRATLAAARVADVPQRLGASERIVWLSRAGTLAPVVVTVGISDGVYTEVSAGQIRAGELAVVEGDAGEGQAGP